MLSLMVRNCAIYAERELLARNMAQVRRLFVAHVPLEHFLWLDQ
jgi:hypothetical protein